MQALSHDYVLMGRHIVTDEEYHQRGRITALVSRRAWFGFRSIHFSSMTGV